MKYIVVIVVVLLLVGLGGYYVMNMNTMKSDPVEMTNNENTGGMESNMPEVSSVPAPMTEASQTAMTEETVKEFTVEGSPFKFEPNTITVNQGDTVKITFKNVAGMHDFVIDEFNVKSEETSSGESTTVTFTADKAGNFEYYCSVMDHRQKGMTGTLVVR